MDATISGITAADRMELKQLEGHGAKFTEDNTLDHAEGDMGIFTIGVPVTIAVIKLVEKWLETRTPLTEISITTTSGGSASVKTKGHKMDPTDLGMAVAVLKSTVE